MTMSRARRRFRRLARLHFWVMFFMFVSYLGLGFSLGPEFLVSDTLKKIHVLADDIITVTAVVLGPPEKPIVTATPVCVSGSPRISLDWADDDATDTWDIDRDSSPLTTGLAVSQYSDTAVVTGNTYGYVVTAYGPMAPGSAVSDPVSATAPDCPVLPPATVTIQTLAGTNVTTDRDDIRFAERRPELTGVANIADAIIDISVTNPTIQARITANSNGYFFWTPPVKLDTGNHSLSVTVTDPGDSSRTATDSLTFHIEDEEEEDGDEDEDEEDRKGAVVAGIPPRGPLPNFFVRLNSVDGAAFTGDVIDVAAISLEGRFPTGTEIRFFLVNRKGEEVLRLGTVDDAGGRSEVHMSKELPLSLEPGAYTVRVDAFLGGTVVSREVALMVRALPLIRLGEGNEITYQEVASFVGTAFYLLLFLFLILLLLFVREYGLYLRSLRHITERNLMGLGFFGSGKGVKS